MGQMKILLMLTIFVTMHSQASDDCSVMSGFKDKKTLCWKESIKAEVSKDCLKIKCEALHVQVRFPKATAGREDSLAEACAKAGADMIVLGDQAQNESSYCEFEDGSLRDAPSVQLAIHNSLK